MKDKTKNNPRAKVLPGTAVRTVSRGVAKAERATIVSRKGVPGPPELVVFAGINDLGCAQMAAAWFPMLAEARKARAVLAVPRAPTPLPPYLAAAMSEVGIDLKMIRTDPLTSDLLESADLVVTMGETFERGFLGTSAALHREHWMVAAEPANTDGPGRARSLRDLIRSRVAMLVFTEGWGRADITREAARVTRPRWHAEPFAAF